MVVVNMGTVLLALFLNHKTCFKLLPVCYVVSVHSS